MAVYDGKKLAQEALLDTAAHLAQAALHAPQITGRTKIQVEIVTGEDLEDAFYVADELNKVGVRTAGIEQYKEAAAMGEPPVVVLVGADVTRSELNWDCGACGQTSCKAFNNWSRKERSWGVIWQGPSCIWKAMDLGIAADWAAAAGHNYNVTTRVQMIPGGLFTRMGFLEGASMALSMGLGPVRENWYFEPGSGRKVDLNAVQQGANARRVLASPSLYIRFLGPGKHQGQIPIKTRQDFWEEPTMYLKAVEDPEWDGLVRKRMERIDEVCAEVKARRKARRSLPPAIKPQLSSRSITKSVAVPQAKRPELETVLETGE